MMEIKMIEHSFQAKKQGVLDLRQTEIALKMIKDYFEKRLAAQLNLIRVSAPLFVDAASGLNDNLNGIERPVVFKAKDLTEKRIEIVQSLAKWKRLALKRYGFREGEGIYTDMNAIRRDEDLDHTHSVYVDQWDWEKIISKEERTPMTLKAHVKLIYRALKDTEKYICEQFTELKPTLPDEISFITTQELEDMFFELSPEARENEITKKLGAVFVMQVGYKLRSGIKHGGRSPDYDDWMLNGDIIVWHHGLKQALELSSMGIRVDKVALLNQLKCAGRLEQLALPYHQRIMNGELPFSIGGGIGQSRMCLQLLNKRHVGEVQASIWPQYIVDRCAKEGITLL